MADIDKHNPNNSSQIALVAEPLVQQLRELIENTRQRVASIVCDETTQMYWNVGNAINTFVLQGKRAEYGKQIIVSVARQLVAEYGDSFEEKNLRRMMQFATEYPDFEIVASLIRQLTWPHIIALLPIREPLKRSFYEQMAITEHWSTRKKVLEQKLQKAIAYASERMAIQEQEKDEK